METDYKKLLGDCVENIFKRYSEPGLHICDLLTGSGKSYTIGKLTCEYYPKHFDKIVILCVQNKLVREMTKEIQKFIGSKDSCITEEDVVTIENNAEVIQNAFEDGSLEKLEDEMYKAISSKNIDENSQRKLKYHLSSISKFKKNIGDLIKAYYSLYSQNSAKVNTDIFSNQIDYNEAELRKSIKKYLDEYKKYCTKGVQLKDLLKKFPSLEKVYPQVNLKSKRIALMTVHKAMYSIDPILSDKIFLKDFSRLGKRVLILFDESDQAATAMRESIISQATNGTYQNRFGKGYNCFLEYRNLLEATGRVSNAYKGLDQTLERSKESISKVWKTRMNDIEAYKNILPDENENLEEFRRGVFFCGPLMKLDIHKDGDKSDIFICHEKDRKDFTLVTSKNGLLPDNKYDLVISIKDFLDVLQKCITIIKYNLSNLVRKSYEENLDKFNRDISQISLGECVANQFIGYPSLTREIHTLLSRFETNAEKSIEHQLYDFITNRKNLIFDFNGKKEKYLDNSIYTQGFQFYQIELDDFDDKHRIRISCREIETTPEKILIDLVNSDNTSVVLCSATASCESVINNFDITYLKHSLANKINTLSDIYRDFEDLSYKTYPSDHKINIIPIEGNGTQAPLARTTLPPKYETMFCEEARKKGYVKRWFRCTKNKLGQESEDATYEKKETNIAFQLNRILQFIEVYHFFYITKDIHSMLFFQNRLGDKDSDQFNVISCLIDGSCKNMSWENESSLPSWKNEHICISNSMEFVQKNVLNKLSTDKDAKVMLISSYASFKAGANLQYAIPNHLNYLKGDNWDATDNNQQLRKDWDSIYLQKPTNYLNARDEGIETTYETTLYRTMLSLMMLFERGCLSDTDVERCMFQALTGKLYFSTNMYKGAIKDQSAWAWTTIEQAVGRLCRTRNKPQTTYILYDSGITESFVITEEEKPYSKEFRLLKGFIAEQKAQNSFGDDCHDIQRANDANAATRQLKMFRNKALTFLPRKGHEDNQWKGNKEDFPESVKRSQDLIQIFKDIIIRKPVLKNMEELSAEDLRIPFISQCYGKWDRNEYGGYNFRCRKERICNNKEGELKMINPSTIRLDIMMKNKVIYDYFQDHQFATEWKDGDYILHPVILKSDYCGEIGEQAFKALAIHYAGCKEDDLRHLEYEDYEYADFVLCNPDGSYRIAFDVKNMDPRKPHQDQDGELETTKKRKEKLKQLSCPIITVNILEMEPGINREAEIYGLIDNNGEIIERNMKQLIDLINPEKK